MATWDERLVHIRALREERKKRDEDLYTLQIRMRKAASALQLARKKETSLPHSPSRVAQVRKSIATYEARLRQLGSGLRDLDALQERLDSTERRLTLLDTELQAVGTRITEAQARAVEEQHKPAPDQEVLDRLGEQIRNLMLVQSRLLAEREQISRELESARERLAQASGEKERIEAERASVRELMASLVADLASELRADAPDATQAEGLVATLHREYTQAKERLEKSRADLHEAISSFYGDARPHDLVANLSDDIPLLLLPVRIETRFVSTPRSPELWLRIYPDDIAVHTHETVLTDKEVSEGERYWRMLWDVRTASGSQAEDKRKSAWNYLADLFGAQRAAWVAGQTRPTNWNSPEREPSFPAHELTKTSSWTRAPRTHVLPDKFVVMLYEGEALVHEAVGNQIPDELMVGPDPLEEDDAFVEKSGKLAFGAAFDWSSDFGKAVAAGMGFRIPITAAQAVRGFSKILVLGLSLSADEAEGKDRLEALIDNHHYSPKGFSLVRQGTPSNNTEEHGSGYTRNDEFNAISYFVETGEPLFTETSDTDGRRLADALGIEYSPLQFVRNSDATDHREAAAMNVLLYPGTLGYYFDTLLEPVLGDDAQGALREFFVKRVTGRGPLPAIRVGNQPYGVLLTSDFGRWQWSRNEPGFTQGFLQSLHHVVKRYHEIWLGLLGEVQHVGKPATEGDPAAMLMNILGLQAGSASFHQRIGYSTDYLRNLDEFQFGGRYFDDLQQHFTSKNAALAFLTALGYDERDAQGRLKVPQLLRLLYQHYHTALDAANLIDDVPLSEREPIRHYDAAAQKNYLHWLAEAQSVVSLETQDFGPAKPPTALLYLMARRALLLQLHKASVRWLLRNQVDLRPTLGVKNFFNIRAQPDVTRWEAMKAKVAVALPQHPEERKSVSDYLLSTGRSQTEASFLNEMRDALKILAPLPTARLERCFTEHSDTCTYRLDSWQSAMFGVRLANQRQAGAADGQERRKGIYLGAYGWIEDLRPATRQEVSRESIPEKLRPANGEPLYEYSGNGGFIHAPSLNQASAAAVLRAGYLSHARSNRPDALSVNLSSERIRRALFILQGIRNGQTLEALLGYQFERGLHDAASADVTLIKLNEYVYDFRDRFPLERHALKQQGSDAPAESVPSTSVVNGVKLADATGDTPYGATGAVATASESEKRAIRKEKDRLSDTLDAVKDLLQSEAVYQMVQGNFDRASAVINALQNTSVPPEIDIINTPRSSEFTFTNRVMVQFAVLDPQDPGSNPWSPIPMTSRAKMEPGLNAWLGKLLGPPDALVCRVAHLDVDGNELGSANVTVGSLALQPIDLFYITGNELNTGAAQQGENRTSVSELEMRIAWHYRVLKALNDATRIRIEFLKPAGQRTLGVLLPLLRMLKSMVTDARALHAQDFDPPSKQSLADKNNPEAYDPDELLNRVQAASTAFQNMLADIRALSIDAVVKDKNGNDQHYSTLQAAFAALEEEKLQFSAITFFFANADAVTLQAKLRAVADVGLPDAFPLRQSILSDEDKAVLLDQAMSVARRMKAADDVASARLDEANAASETTAKVRLRVAAAKALMGDAFNVLPRFAYNNEADIQVAHAASSQLLQHARNALKMAYPAEEWMQSVAQARPKIARWDSVLSLCECLNNERLDLQPIQVPYRENDSWLAVEFPQTHPADPSQPFNIEHDTLSLVIHGEAAFTPAAAHCGLLIDDWVELIPTRNETTGIAFNYDQPNTAPPQTLLLAVTPQVKGHWAWDDVVGILNDTLLRAKLRAVEPRLLDTVNKAEVGVLLPAIVADFTQYDLNVALDYRLNLGYVAANVPIEAVTLRS
jgi:hypothetical protein